MKVAVSAQGSGLDAAMDPHFGRAASFVIVDTGSGAAEAVVNDGATAAHAAGITAARVVADRGVECVITGRVGPKAEQALKAAGIRVVIGDWRTVKEALESLKGSW